MGFTPPPDSVVTQNHHRLAAGREGRHQGPGQGEQCFLGLSPAIRHHHGGAGPILPPSVQQAHDLLALIVDDPCDAGLVGRALCSRARGCRPCSHRQFVELLDFERMNRSGLLTGQADPGPPLASLHRAAIAQFELKFCPRVPTIQKTHLNRAIREEVRIQQQAQSRGRNILHRGLPETSPAILDLNPARIPGPSVRGAAGSIPSLAEKECGRNGDPD